MNWMTTAKKRVGKTSKKAKREEASRLGAWMKVQQPYRVDNDFIQEFTQCQIIDFYNDGERCDESGRALIAPRGLSVEKKSPRDGQDNFKKALLAQSTEISIPSSSVVLVESDRNRWWNRTVQKLTTYVEVPVVDYIKLDLQLKDVSLNGCADIFSLVTENSDATAVVNPKFDTRTVLRSLYKAINHLRMDTDSLSTILDLIRYLEIVDKQNSKPAVLASKKVITPAPRTVESIPLRLPLEPIKSKSKIAAVKVAAVPRSEPDENSTAIMEDWNLFGLRSISCLSIPGERADEGKDDRTDPVFECKANSEIAVGDMPRYLEQTSYTHFSPGNSPREKIQKVAHSQQPTPGQDNHCDFLTDLSFIQFD
eukprot:gene33292-43047_t